MAADIELDRVGRIARDLRAGDDLDAADRDLAASILEASAERDAEMCRQARAEVERLVRELAERHAGHLASARAKAHFVDETARRYQASAAWRKDRGRVRLPTKLRAAPEQFVWLALKSGEPFPAYEKIRKILTSL